MGKNNEHSTHRNFEINKYSSAIVAVLGSAPTGPIIKATLTNVTLPNTRGKAFSLFTILNVSAS